MILVLVGLVALLGFVALGVDLGLAYNARTQAQAAADATALAAAAEMIDSTGPTVTLADSQAAAVDIASRNSTLDNPTLAIDAQDITFGNWDLATRTLDTAVDLTDPDQVTAVQTVVRLDGNTNASVPAVFSRVLGRQEFTVATTATAYLGFAGSFGPGQVELPIAIPCCVLNGDQCTDDFCGNGAPVPNPCPLNQPQPRGDNSVSCIQFHNTDDQTGCWTEFDGEHSAVNTSDLVDIVRNDLGTDISVNDDIFLDNGDKVPVIDMISDRFYGDDEFYGSPEGVDTDGDTLIDSWITAFPVVACQNEDHCAKGLPADVVGFVCFEIREITVTPDKMIRGTFLCPDLHPARFQQCLAGIGTTGSGGTNFGIRADIPVLVR